ncbi:MliC family protein [Brevundimonas fluminis]|jgi:hypothetical protein|uniref:MliC family protein n=1 Tax=Brevundimonas fluminis TaxID=2487274 RepID=UPI000F657625|nr:MliC family protein [Brevundimonas fluminis]
MRLTTSVILIAALAALGGCGEPTPVTDDAEAVRERALDAQTARRRTGAEIQERALHRVVRAVYLCDNGERLSVDFDNAREMATVRTSMGEAIDLFMERAPEGLWYRASGHELRGRGQFATWASEDAEPTDCRAVD